MEVYCGLCGHRAHELFSHIRTVHEMTADRYQERCPEAPLVSDDLASYMVDNQIVPDGEGLKRQVTLFGVEFLSDILPGELVPDCDADYVLQEDLCQKVLLSPEAGENVPAVIGASAVPCRAPSLARSVRPGALRTC